MQTSVKTSVKTSYKQANKPSLKMNVNATEKLSKATLKYTENMFFLANWKQRNTNIRKSTVPKNQLISQKIIFMSIS